MNDRLQLLMAVHSHLVDAAKLPKSSRPYSVQTRLDLIEKQIMEELDNSKTSTPPSPEPITKGYPASGDDDNIPF